MTYLRAHKRAVAAALIALCAIAAAPAAAAEAGGAVEFAAAPVSDATLQTTAGREDVTQVAQSQQNATVTRNSVGDNSQTGQVQIQDNAFQNLSGLSLLNVNTGNNVAMNATMNVNISINPAP